MYIPNSRPPPSPSPKYSPKLYTPFCYVYTPSSGTPQKLPLTRVLNPTPETLPYCWCWIALPMHSEMYFCDSDNMSMRHRWIFKKENRLTVYTSTERRKRCFGRGWKETKMSYHRREHLHILIHVNSLGSIGQVRRGESNASAVV